MENKEKIYDEQISPLLRKVAEICQKEGLPFFSEVQFSETGFCKSFNIMESNVFQTYHAISQCKTEDTINIDKFLFWVLKTFNCEASIFLNKFAKRADNKDCAVPSPTETTPKSADADFAQS